MGILGILLMLIPLIIAFSSIPIARKKGRSAGAWFLINILFSLPGILVLLVLPSLKHNCPNCECDYAIGDENCSECGAKLPDQFTAEYLVSNGKIYDLECPNCGTPYRREDYREDAEQIFCSKCKGELPV